MYLGVLNGSFTKAFTVKENILRFLLFDSKSTFTIKHEMTK